MNRSGHRRLAIRALLVAILAAAAVPAAAGPSIPELVEVADITSLSASPSGRRVVFRIERASIARNTYSLDWYVADLETGDATHLAGGGAPIEGKPPVPTEIREIDLEARPSTTPKNPG